MESRRRTAVAIGVSLLAHLLFFLALWWVRPAVLAPPVRSEPVSVRIIHLPPLDPRSPTTGQTQAQVSPRPEAPSPARSPPHGQKPSAAPRATASATPPATRSPSPPAAQPGGTSPGGAQGPREAPHLPPQLGLSQLPAGVAAPEAPEGPGGHTVHNDGRTGPTPQEIAQQDAHARANVQQWSEDDLARTRVADGAVDGFFSDLRKSLEASAKYPPPFKPKQGLSYEQSWAHDAQSFGKTGALEAGRIPEGEMRDFENHHNPIPEPGTNAEHIAQGLGGTMLRAHASEGADAPGLVAIVEVLQRRDGAAPQVALRKPSGDKNFDAFVLKAAREGAEHAPKMPTQGVGIHPQGTRSVWAYRGSIVFTKSISELKKEGKSAAAIAARSALSILGGGLGFDETKGEVDVSDSTPTYKVKVALLAVY